MTNCKHEALADVKIMEFAWAFAGPWAASYFAYHGATVIRLESSHYLDSVRNSLPYKDGVPGVNRSGNFAWKQANKYSLGLNLRHPKGPEVVKKLVSKVDIVTENFSPGVMHRLGMDYDELRKIKPDIIMISLSIFGQEGPYAQSRGFGTQVAGAAGIQHLVGWSDRGPSALIPAYSDKIAADVGALGLLAALSYRNRTGKGVHIDLSQVETSVSCLGPLILDYFVNGREATRTGNACGWACPHGAYRCKGDDRWCVIAVYTDEEWKHFCKVVGNTWWTQEGRFSTLLDRKENEQELNGLIEEWTSNFEAEEVMNLLQEAGVPAGMVKDPAEVREDAQLGQRGYFWKLNHPEIGWMTHAGTPMILSETPYSVTRPSPCLGEHTEYVCKEVLGLSDEEFMELYKTGVFE